MLSRVRWAGVALVFFLALLDASQDLGNVRQPFSIPNLLVIGIAIAGALPLAMAGLAWQLVTPGKHLSTFLSATYFILLFALVVAWGTHVFQGAAPAEGAQQMHLLLLPILSLALAVVTLLACHLGARIISHVAPRRGT